MYCKNCGRELPEGLDMCPYCGADRYGKVETVEKKKKEKKIKYVAPRKKASPLYSILGFVFSIGGISFLPLIGSIIGFVLSCIGISESRKTNANCGGLGIAGLIISMISLIIYLALITVFILMELGIITKFSWMNF